jgi:hypothetical protein
LKKVHLIRVIGGIKTVLPYYLKKFNPELRISIEVCESISTPEEIVNKENG